MNKLQKICIIHIFFGNWPAWIAYFLQSCAANTSIDFLIISDQFLPYKKPENLQQVLISRKEFSKKIAEKLDVSNPLNDAYKLCDFKPCYGKILEDYLNGYEFWAYCDNDLVFGNLRSYLTPELLKTADIISAYKGFAAGPLTLYRNIPEINTLYKGIHHYKTQLEKPEYIGIDEKVLRHDTHGISLYKMLYYFKYFIRYFNWQTSFKELRYQFQWSYMKNTIDSKAPIDITELLWQQQNLRGRYIHFKSWMHSDAQYSRMNKKHWRLVWNGSGLFMGNKEIAAYHFFQSKKTNRFTVDAHPGAAFHITEKGIFAE